MSELHLTENCQKAEFYQYMDLPPADRHFAFWLENELQLQEIEFSGTEQQAMSKQCRQ